MTGPVPLFDEYRELSDEELAMRIAGDVVEERRRARSEASRRFGPACDRVAAVNCRRLAHRGRPCRGWLDNSMTEHAFPILSLTYAQRVAGREEDDPRGALKSLMVAWAGRGRVSGGPREFEPYIWQGGNGPGGLEEALRTWNAARELVQRMRFSRPLQEGFDAAYGDLVSVEPSRRAAAETGLTEPEHGRMLVKALWWDACQTGLAEPIDAERVSRHAAAETGRENPDATFTRSVAVLADAVDRIVHALDSDWYGTNLSRPRSQTRQPVLVEDMGELERRGGIDPPDPEDSDD